MKDNRLQGQMRLTKLFKDFFDSERAGGIVLVFVTLFSLILANSLIANEYLSFWIIKIGHHTVVEWINDGLMTIFFLLIGLELKREIYIGELADIKKAALPIFGAFGGMLIPAFFYFLLNFGTDKMSGAGIPMATDIAFAIGILSLLGKRVPVSLKVFLTALAVIDDLGAIIVIALFYTKSLVLMNVFYALLVFLFLLILKHFNVKILFLYIIGGILMWYFMLYSGVHATITGVLLAFAIPFDKKGNKSLSGYLEHHLNKPVAFFILPLFAISNTCIAIGSDLGAGLFHASSLGILAGLIFGKPIGIWLFSFLSVKFGFCELPRDINWKNIFGAGLLGGIGFTMSIFITLLAFNSDIDIYFSKMSILIASFIAGVIGYTYLHLTLGSVQKSSLRK